MFSEWKCGEVVGNASQRDPGNHIGQMCVWRVSNSPNEKMTFVRYFTLESVCFVQAINSPSVVIRDKCTSDEDTLVVRLWLPKIKRPNRDFRFGLAMYARHALFCRTTLREYAAPSKTERPSKRRPKGQMRVLSTRCLAVRSVAISWGDSCATP